MNLELNKELITVMIMQSSSTLSSRASAADLDVVQVSDLKLMSREAESFGHSIKQLEEILSSLLSPQSSSSS